MPGKQKKYIVLSWAMYDLANQFFVLNIVSMYFPRWLTMEKGVPETFRLEKEKSNIVNRLLQKKKAEAFNRYIEKLKEKTEIKVGKTLFPSA